MFVDYWQFINRKLPQNEIPTGFDVIPYFYYKTAIWSLFFTIMNVIVPVLTRFLFPKWYKSLLPRDRREFPSYFVCLIHHIAMVPFAWYHVYQDALLTNEIARTVDYASLEAYVGPFCLGYLIGDTVTFAFLEMLSLRFEYIIHHSLTIWLVSTAVFGPGNLLRFIPHLILCDTTNIFFNISWLLRRCGWKNSLIVTLLEILFAFFFLLVRVINLPCVFFIVTINPLSLQWGLARYCLIPISIMQWFWFYKIATTMYKRITTNTTTNTNTKNNKFIKLKSKSS